MTITNIKNMSRNVVTAIIIGAFAIASSAIAQTPLGSGVASRGSTMIGKTAADPTSMPYDATASGLTSTTTQAAIDELAAEKITSSDMLFAVNVKRVAAPGVLGRCAIAQLPPVNGEHLQFMTATAGIACSQFNSLYMYTTDVLFTAIDVYAIGSSDTVGLSRSCGVCITLDDAATCVAGTRADYPYDSVAGENHSSVAGTQRFRYGESGSVAINYLLPANTKFSIAALEGLVNANGTTGGCAYGQNRFGAIFRGTAQ